jgi:hypothetical protein
MGCGPVFLAVGTLIVASWSRLTSLLAHRLARAGGVKGFWSAKVFARSLLGWYYFLNACSHARIFSYHIFFFT